MTEIPYGNFTALNHDIFYGWESSATKRGTSDIIYSCLVTITLCIYTSIHLNIPDPQETSRQKYLRLAKWVVIGIFAPEWVIFAAWRQWKDAREFLKDIKRYTESAEGTVSAWQELESVVVTKPDVTSQSHNEGSQPDRKDPEASSSQYNIRPRTESYAKKGHVADMTYAFYVLMGGLRVDVSDISDQFQSVSLTKEGLTDIVKNGGYYHVQLDRKLIDDRSKANYLAKLLVCCQVIWMATQCITRKASGLPLTLLELHTFAHVFCALLIYLFWIKKPLSVNEATTITLPDKFRSKIALAVCLRDKQAVKIDLDDQQSTSYVKGPTHIVEQDILQAKCHILQPDEKYKGAITGMLETCDYDCRRKPRLLHWSHPHPRDQAILRLYHTSPESRDPLTQDLIVEFDPNDDEGMLVLRLHPEGEYIRVKVQLTDKHILRRRLAAKVDLTSTDFQVTKTCSDSRQTTYPTDYTNYTLIDSLVHFVHADPFVYTLPYSKYQRQSVLLPDPSVTDILVTILMPCIYGVIHLCAWNWSFPSKAEKWMWRVSAICVTSSLPTLKLLMVILEVHDDLLHAMRIGSRMQECLFNIWDCVHVLLFCILALSRLFLVLEVFMSLRAVPIGVYATISWMQYIPHF